MWFDIIKLDLSQVSTQIQGDTEGKNINIPESSKCLDKLLNFAKKTKRAFGPTPSAKVKTLEKDHRHQMPESVACKLVEMIDKMFSQNSEKYKDEEAILKDNDINDPTTTTFLDVNYEMKEGLKNFDKFLSITAGFLLERTYIIDIHAPNKGLLSLKHQKKIMEILKMIWEES